MSLWVFLAYGGVPPTSWKFAHFLPHLGNSHWSCTIFIFTSYSLYTQAMLILILIGVEFERGSNSHNHSCSSSHYPTKNPPSNLEESQSLISDAWSVISSITTFYLTKTENRTKKSLIQLSYYRFCFDTIRYISQSYMCLCLHIIFQVSSITPTSLKQRTSSFPPP